MGEGLQRAFKAARDSRKEIKVREERDRLRAAINRLRAAIITHRAQKADDRCIEDDDRLYEALGDGIKCDRAVGDKAAMLRNCQRFIERRCVAGKWPTYAELELQLAEALKWKNEDPRMLREQIRVADEAYQYLHKQSQNMRAAIERELANWDRDGNPCTCGACSVCGLRQSIQ